MGKQAKIRIVILFAARSTFLLFEFGPRAKTSGHPWSRVYFFAQVWRIVRGPHFWKQKYEQIPGECFNIFLEQIYCLFSNYSTQGGSKNRSRIKCMKKIHNIFKMSGIPYTRIGQHTPLPWVSADRRAKISRGRGQEHTFLTKKQQKIYYIFFSRKARNHTIFGRPGGRQEPSYPPSDARGPYQRHFRPLHENEASSQIFLLVYKFSFRNIGEKIMAVGRQFD